MSTACTAAPPGSTPASVPTVPTLETVAALAAMVMSATVGGSGVDGGGAGIS